jgi:hypothetical protein
MKAAIRKRTVICILTAAAILIGSYTVLVTWRQPDGQTTPRANTILFIAMVISLGVGFFVATFAFTRRVLERSPLSTESGVMISPTLWFILKEHLVECVLFLVIIGFLSCNLAAWMENMSKMTPTSFGPTYIAMFVALVSTLVTTVGMHYAFLAERNSAALLSEKADFLDDFAGFIRRINRKIDEIRNDIREDQQNEQHYYFVKCMFLTPFLGHAGLTPDNKSLHNDYDRFRKNIAALVNNPNCEVKILTLEPKRLIEWYYQIAWVDEAQRQKKPGGQLTEEELARIHQAVLASLREKKGTGAMRMEGGTVTVDSFSDLCATYEKDFAGDTQKPVKLEVCHIKHIPFQLFLVTRPVIKNPDKFPSRDSFKKYEGTDLPVENGCFLVLSFVGDRTYYNLIEDMRQGGTQLGNGGVDGLLRDLHSAIYSDDPRMCRILNNHFMHLWDTTRTHPHYPMVQSDLWNNISVKGVTSRARVAK